jgi:hypothetical protein
MSTPVQRERPFNDEHVSAVTCEIKTVSGVPNKVWTICRKYSELQLSGRLTLLQWAERARLRSDDYVFDRHADAWVCARQLAELKGFFRKQKARRMQRVTWALVAIAAVTHFVTLVSGLFLVAAAAMFTAQHRLE